MVNSAFKMPKYLPHMQHKDVITMGMQSLHPQKWTEPDEEYPRYLEHKLSLGQTHKQRVFDALPSAYDVQVELVFELKNHLLQHHSQLYCSLADGLNYLPMGIQLPSVSPHPLWQASLWVADDLLIMQKLDGQYCLTAASLCSPSNWPLQASAHLAQFPEKKVIHAANTPLYYRCERQTLTRLPQTNAIAFTIRAYVYPLMSLTQVPNALTQLQVAINAMPKSVAGYKDIIYFAPALQKYFSDLSLLK